MQAPKPIHVSILVPEKAVPACIVDARYMFTAVNQFLAADGQLPLYTIDLVGMTPQVHLMNGLMTLQPSRLLTSAEPTDLVLIPAMSGLSSSLADDLAANHAIVHWVQQQYRQGAQVASMCIGAFLLASTGLLNGRQCSTHWMYAAAFRRMFPHVILADDRIITEDSGLYTSGGATSYWNMLLWLVEKHAGREMAIQAAKFFLLDMERSSQSPFAIFKGQYDHDDDTVRRAQQHIEANYASRLAVEELADLLALSRRSLERRFKKATSNTVNEYVQRVKMEVAKKLFEISPKHINEVMYEVGYTDAKAFREVFKKCTGLTPADYRSRYNKQAAVA